MLLSVSAEGVNNGIAKDRYTLLALKINATVFLSSVDLYLLCIAPIIRDYETYFFPFVLICPVK